MGSRETDGRRGAPHPALRPGLRIDRIGTEAVVLDPAGGRVHRLTGDSSEVLRLLVADGREVADLPARLAPAVLGLRTAGVLRGGVGRRRALATAAVGAVGIVTMALPTAAAATSDVDGTGSGGYDDSTDGTLDPVGITFDGDYHYRVFTASGEFVVNGDGALGVDVLIVGGGGGGGYYAGGGGGGGAVSVLLNQTLPKGATAVTVGDGGLGNYGGEESSVASIGSAGGGGAGGGYGGVGGASPVGSGSGSDGHAGGARNGFVGGGGAGAGGAGQDAAGGAGGDGGSAFATADVFGAVLAVGGGGGGGGGGSGGSGGEGAGDGASEGLTGQSAVANRGGGGGGTGYIEFAAGGTGGSGLVIVRYPR